VCVCVYTYLLKDSAPWCYLHKNIFKYEEKLFLFNLLVNFTSKQCNCIKSLCDKKLYNTSHYITMIYKTNECMKRMCNDCQPLSGRLTDFIMAKSNFNKQFEYHFIWKSTRNVRKITSFFPSYLNLIPGCSSWKGLTFTSIVCTQPSSSVNALNSSLK